MEVILLERIEKLGQMGDVVKVKPGYARNFLLPQGKAIRANKNNLERFETEKAQREADNLSRRSEAETEAGKMDGLAVSMVRAASEMGQLFGSVTSRDIAEAVTQAGFTITRNQVVMEKAIKTLGLHAPAPSSRGIGHGHGQRRAFTRRGEDPAGDWRRRYRHDR